MTGELRDRRWFLGTAAAAAMVPAIRPRHHHSVSAHAALATALGATVPVTILNTGTFNTGPTLPAGVTLQAIDGGATYYTSNGFTFAASPDATMLAAGAKSWDDPSFFPIGNDFCFYPSNYTTGGLATFRDLGLNFTHRCTSDVDMTVLHANGVWALLDGPNTNYGNETFGWHVEEPSSWNDSGDANSVASQVAQFGPLPGRVLQCSDTWVQLFYETSNGGLAPPALTMPQMYGETIPGTSPARHLNVPSADIYYFAGSTTTDSTGPLYEGAGVETGNLSPIATADQMARGTNYGDMVDIMRNDWLGSAPAVSGPVIAPYIETEDGLVPNSGARRILPAELNWAAWSTIIHGARGLLYFGTTSNFGSGSTFGFGTAVLSGETISVYAQAKNTNGLVQNLARVINAPFALGYVTVSPAAYNFPAPLVSDAKGIRNGWGVTGIDVMAKYYTGGGFTNAAGTFGNGLYIFATYRGSKTASNVPATFTVAGGYSGPVHAINADGGSSAYGTAYTLTATGGVFTDTFAKGSSVRIYQMS